MFATGLYKDECKAWNRLVPLSRTWPTFKLIFTAAARELRKMQALTGNTGYANNVAETEELMEQTATALSTLAQARIEDREAVSNVVTTNTNLKTQMENVLTALTAIQTRITTLEGGQHPAPAPPANTGGRQRNRSNNTNNESYCHTHGRTRRNDHTSATCNHPVEGHITTATLHNRQGGSNRYCGNTE